MESRLKLIDNWKEVLRKSWSVRLIGLDIGMSAAEIVVPQFSDVMPKGVFLVLSLVLLAVRLMRQPNIGGAK